MASTTEEVLRRHVKYVFEGDLEGIVSAARYSSMTTSAR
jgi:hypothetical protein